MVLLGGERVSIFGRIRIVVIVIIVVVVLF